MKTSLPMFAAPWLALSLVILANSAVTAGTFKHITIDGSFADWAGVPVAASDDEGDAIEGFDLREIYAANDDQYLYFMVKIYPSSANANYSQFHHHFYIDSDDDPSTGFGGTEMAIEDDYAFSQRYGVNWSDGMVTGLDPAQAPPGELTSYQYEYRVSRAVRDKQPADVPAGSGNPERDLPVFAQDDISIRWDVLTGNWSAQDAGPSFLYEMASAPPPFAGTELLIDLTSTVWNVNDSGTDLGMDWLAADYDDTQAGWQSGTGLFGFNAPAGIYPAPINTGVSSGKPAYYLRTHFTWNYDLSGVGLLISNYLSAGAVFYLNGSEVIRIRMPFGTVSYNTAATGGPSQPGIAELVDLLAGALVVGDNVLEVEIHPAAGAGNSLVFGLSLTASDSFAPRILDPSQPADRSVTEGQSTTFSAGVVAGTGPFTYQWLKDGTPITGATEAFLTVDPALHSDSGGYSVEITNPKGLKVASRVAVLATVAVPVALADASQPVDQLAAEGLSVVFEVAATGTLAAYQWYRDDVAIEGETGPLLTLGNISLSDSGAQFWVTVSNRLNSVTSRKATLTVVNDSTPPAITSVAGGGRHVLVTFAEPVDSGSAQQAANYSLNGGAQVQEAALDATNPNAVRLTTTLQAFGQPYTLSVNGVKDLFGNAAHATFHFRSAILVDGDFDDWSSVPVGLIQDQTNPGSIEFKELSITNDADYIYIRFSFYEPAGPLAAASWDSLGNYWQVIFDTDADPTTGGYNGGEVMNEVNTLLRLGGDWTDGAYEGADTALAPAETMANDFEFRVSLHATHERDHLPAFPNPAIGVFCVIRNTSWSELDVTDYNPSLSYTIAAVAPINVAITAKRVGGKIELAWPGGGILETRGSLSAGTWVEVPGAVSGIQINPASSAAGFYRVRQ